MSESETVAKNRIEFQRGSKLQGTSSEALIETQKQTLKEENSKITIYNRLFCPKALQVKKQKYNRYPQRLLPEINHVNLY